MQTSWRVVVVLVFVFLAAAGILAGQREPVSKTGFFSPLRKDLQVILKEGATGYILRVAPDVPPNLKVVEVGADYVVIEDITGITQTRIPITSIQAITVSKFTTPR